MGKDKLNSGKHVIILGAGASCTSGYPLAGALRTILSSEAEFWNYIENRVPLAALAKKLLETFKQQQKAITLFREGGFATVDEFSSLARARFHWEIRALKYFISLVLALHNPEEPYVINDSEGRKRTTGLLSSDYYSFVQKLFSESFHDLREDVVILTFNYDPYLEFLLGRAYRRRKESCGLQADPKTNTSIYSGFDQRRREHLVDGKGFCLLKLHGTAVLPVVPRRQGAPSEYFSFYEVFWDRQELLKILYEHQVSLSPIFFPWELIKDNGEFISPTEFAPYEEDASACMVWRAEQKPLYPVCRAIWERARVEVTQASKISFVGFSLHRFMETGLKFLFSERAERIEAGAQLPLEVVTACPESVRTHSRKGPPTPNRHVARLEEMLKRMNVGFDIPGLPHSVLCYENFNNFIQDEL